MNWSRHVLIAPLIAFLLLLLSTMLQPSLLPLARSHWPSILRPPNGTLSKLQASLFAARRLSSTVSARTSSANFSYRISASFSAKQHPLNLTRNLYNHNPLSRTTKGPDDLPPLAERRHGRHASGQDAFFVGNIAATDSVAFGVLDGVGGWTESGVDPSDFSHSLGEYMTSIAGTFSPTAKEGKLIRPRDLLDLAYKRVMEDSAVHAGGSTACVATASSDGVLEVANLGDSGYVHISPFRLSHLSLAQTHAFNTPYQLSKIPGVMLQQIALFGGGEHYAEKPADADVYQHDLNHGDVLVLATDGVWDNLSPEDVLRIVSSIMVKFQGWVRAEDGAVGIGTRLHDLASGKTTGDSSSGGLSAILAAAITREAKETSLDSRRDGPFAKEVKKYFPNENYRGGKPDDICTVVVVVLEDGV